MFYLKRKRLYGLAVLVITAALMFILFAVLGLNGVSITAPTSGVLVKLLILLTPTLAGTVAWAGSFCKYPYGNPNRDVSPCIYARVHFIRLPTLPLI